MKKLLSLLFVITFSSVVLGQVNSKMVILKLYNQVSYSEDKRSIVLKNTEYLRTNKDLVFLAPKFAFLFSSKKGNLHEIELSNFNLIRNSEKMDSLNNHAIVGYSTNKTNLAFRYEYTPAIKTKTKKSNSDFNLSLGIQPFFNHRKIIPDISTDFPETITNIGCFGYIAPRFSYKLSDKFYFDINIPFNFIEVNFSSIKIDDPTKNDDERKSTKSNLNFVPKNYNVRFGLAYRI